MKKPLCVDLDGTLIKDDVTLIAAKAYIKRNVFNAVKLLLWIMRGRAYFKYRLAKVVELDASSLNYREDLLEYIFKNKRNRKIFLATACNEIYAQKVAEYLKIFDGVFASNDRVNLRADAKARALVQTFGEDGFMYAGNSKDDVKVWDKTSDCILVSPTKSALKKMQRRKYLLFP